MIDIDIALHDDALRMTMQAAPRHTLAAAKAAMRRTAVAAGEELRKQIKAVSYLKGGDLKGALAKPIIKENPRGVEAEVRVSGKKIALDRFRLKPRRITARKGQRPQQWQEPSYQIGPREKVKRWSEEGPYKRKSFIMRTRNGLKLMERYGPRRGKVWRLYGITPQYFAAFDVTKAAVMARARTVFPQRLRHELLHRLGKMA